MGLFDGTPLQRPVTCDRCEKPLSECRCPRTASGEVLLPQNQTASIRTEKRGKGKLVTLVEGLDPSASDLATLLRQLKSACAAGGTIADGVLELQGDHCEKAEQALLSQGYKTKLR